MQDGSSYHRYTTLLYGQFNNSMFKKIQQTHSRTTQLKKEHLESYEIEFFSEQQT